MGYVEPTPTTEKEWSSSFSSYSVPITRDWLKAVRAQCTVHVSSVVEPDTTFIWLSWIRIRIHKGNSDPDLDSVAWKLRKIYK